MPMVTLNIPLPESFFEEEVICGFKVEQWRKKVWAVELDLLVTLAQVCKDNHLTFFLGGGTLLGAALYKGFIPWDDDVDVYMPRGDYERLCAIAGEVFKEPYFFQTYRSDFGYPRLHAQIRFNGTTGILKCEAPLRLRFNQSIFIDVFPLDAVPEDEEERRGFAKELKSAFKTLSHASVNDIRAIASSIDQLLQKYHSSSNAPRFVNAALSAEIMSGRDMFDYDWVRNAETMEFCGQRFPVPAGWKIWLCQRYPGWYCQKRWNADLCENIHGGVIFDADNGWQDYLRKQRLFACCFRRLKIRVMQSLSKLARSVKTHLLLSFFLFVVLVGVWSMLVVVATRFALNR